MTRQRWGRRVASVVLVGVTVFGCGSDEAQDPVATDSPLVDELVGVLRKSTEPALLVEFDAAQPCLRETFAEYAEPDLQATIAGIRTQDLSTMSDDLRRRFSDDVFSCNEQNRALDAADYKADAEQRIADEGITNVECQLPADISVGASFRCTGNFQSRTSEYRATIDSVGHVVIERTD